MALTGNHGIIIPRDRELLTSLYWREGMSLPAIGRMFGVTHKSVERVLRELGIPRRPKHAPRRTSKCVDCGAPTVNIKHAGHGYVYGSRCREHHRAHYAALGREYAKLPRVKERRDRYMRGWFARHYYGEYAEVWLLLRDVDKEVLSRMTKEEIYAANGRTARHNERSQRHANPFPLRNQPEDRSLGNASGHQVGRDASQPG